MTCRVTIWGARGSIPTPGPLTARYGGNTPCVTLHQDGPEGGSLVILDAGTGIRALGRSLVEASAEPLVADLLLSHTHWDHIQGLPFFAPFYDERSHIRIWGGAQGEVPLERILQEQMNPVVFPVPLHQLDANLTVTHVGPGGFEVSDFAVRAMRLRHPGNTLAYRLSPRSGGPSVVYIPDNELGPGGNYDVEPGWRDELVAFTAEADLLIHDAMFTAQEMPSFLGWGHSSHEEAVALAADANVRRLLLYHHRPERTDDGLDDLFADARRLAAARRPDLEVVAAFEGLELIL
jgi:phosphoribosyl 1,2-cyclic phosphodiesterase